jgi:hypothetical protein
MLSIYENNQVEWLAAVTFRRRNLLRIRGYGRCWVSQEPTCARDLSPSFLRILLT